MESLVKCSRCGQNLDDGYVIAFCCGEIKTCLKCAQSPRTNYTVSVFKKTDGYSVPQYKGNYSRIDEISDLDKAKKLLGIDK